MSEANIPTGTGKSLAQAYAARLAVLREEEVQARAKLYANCGDYNEYFRHLQQIQAQYLEIEKLRKVLYPDNESMALPLRWSVPCYTPTYIKMSVPGRMNIHLHIDGRIDLSTGKGLGPLFGDNEALGLLPYHEFERLMREAVDVARCRWGEIWGTDAADAAMRNTQVTRAAKEMHRSDTLNYHGLGAIPHNPDLRQGEWTTCKGIEPKSLKGLLTALAKSSTAADYIARTWNRPPNTVRNRYDDNLRKAYGRTPDENDYIRVTDADGIDLLRMAGYDEGQIHCILTYIGANGDTVGNIMKKIIIEFRAQHTR